MQDRVVNTKDWAETSDRESSVAGRRPREFYEVADRLLRAEVDLSRNSQVDGTADADRLRQQVTIARQTLYAAAEAR